MDTISLYKHRIDGLMDILFGAGVSNPQTIIEQLNYLLFLRALSIRDDEAELLGISDESEKIFVGDLSKYRWQNLLALNAEDLFKTLEESFDVIQKQSKNSTVKLLFRNAHVKIFDKPTLRRVLHEIEVFAKELDTIAHEGNKDVFGDMYEYLLSKLSSAGTNGQFRTPRHIIDFMVRVVDPKKNETILDPACGTAGFLVAAYRYIAGEYTSEKMKKAFSPRGMDKLSADEKQFLFNHMFSGFDSDEDMIKFGMMNLHLHGLTKSRLVRQNSLTDTTGMKDKFDVILANPPFSGKIDEESVSEDLRMGTKATELLFLRFMMERLSLRGKLAVVVPEGVIFNSSRAHLKIRQTLIENGLWAVVSLPSGVFNPYAGVKTSLLFLDKDLAKTKSELLFIKIENDGFDLGAQRRTINKNDLPAATEALDAWKFGKKVENNLTAYVAKEKVLQNPDVNLSAGNYLGEMNAKGIHTSWPMVKLGDENYFEIVSGGTPSTTKSQYWGGDIKWATLVDLPADQFVSSLSDTKRKITEAGLKESSAVLLPENSVIVSTRATIGRIAINRVPVATNQGFKNLIIKSSKVLPEYVAFSLTKLVTEMETLATGGTFKELSGSKFKTLSIPLPPLEIQKQIVAELNGYQNIVSGAKQVVENWKPTIDIDPEWERVKLGDIIKLSSGKSLTQSKIVKGPFPVYGGNGINGYHNKFFLDEPTVVIGRVGAYCGAVHVTEPKSWVTDNGLYVVEYLKDINVNYLALELDALNINQFAKTGGQPSISQETVTRLEISLPSSELQKRIVDQIEVERKMTETAKQLIPVFEQKAKDRIAKLWS